MGIRSDLAQRISAAHANRLCYVPASTQETQRLRRALLRTDVISPAPRMYALPDYWTQLKRNEQELFKIRTLSRLHPRWVFCDVSAAIVHGLWVSYSLLNNMHIATSRRSHSRSSSSNHLIRHIVENDEPLVVDDVPVSSLARTSFDCLRAYPFRQGLAIADSTLRMSGIARDDLICQFESIQQGHRGWRRAVDIARWANPLSESGGESIARATILEQGYMLPELQVSMRDPVTRTDGYRVDFYWNLPLFPVVGELDGLEKYQNPNMTKGRDTIAVMSDERRRESRLTGSNVKVMRFSYDEVRRTRPFCELMTSYGIPRGFSVPPVALPDDSFNRLTAVRS